MEKYQYRYSMWSSFAFQDSGRQANERERENKEYRRKDKVISDCGLPLPTLTRVRRFASTLDFTLRLLLVFCPRRTCALRYHRESSLISSSITRCVVVGRWNAEREMEWTARVHCKIAGLQDEWRVLAIEAAAVGDGEPSGCSSRKIKVLFYCCNQ